MAECSTPEQRRNLMIDHDGAGPNREIVRRIIVEHEAMEKALREIAQPRADSALGMAAELVRAQRMAQDIIAALPEAPDAT